MPPSEPHSPRATSKDSKTISLHDELFPWVLLEQLLWTRNCGQTTSIKDLCDSYPHCVRLHIDRMTQWTSIRYQVLTTITIHNHTDSLVRLKKKELSVTIFKYFLVFSFLKKNLLFSQKSSIIDISRGRKYTSIEPFQSYSEKTDEFWLWVKIHISRIFRMQMWQLSRMLKACFKIFYFDEQIPQQ